MSYYQLGRVYPRFKVRQPYFRYTRRYIPTALINPTAVVGPFYFIVSSFQPSGEKDSYCPEAELVCYQPDSNVQSFSSGSTELRAYSAGVYDVTFI